MPGTVLCDGRAAQTLHQAASPGCVIKYTWPLILYCTLERDAAERLKRGALQVHVPAVRVQSNNMLFLNIGTLFRCLCPWARHFTLTGFT